MVVAGTGEDGEGAVELLKQDDAGHLVGESHGGEGEEGVEGDSLDGSEPRNEDEEREQDMEVDAEEDGEDDADEVDDDDDDEEDEDEDDDDADDE